MTNEEIQKIQENCRYIEKILNVFYCKKNKQYSLYCTIDNSLKYIRQEDRALIYLYDFDLCISITAESIEIYTIKDISTRLVQDFDEKILYEAEFKKETFNTIGQKLIEMMLNMEKSWLLEEIKQMEFPMCLE